MTVKPQPSETEDFYSGFYNNHLITFRADAGTLIIPLKNVYHVTDAELMINLAKMDGKAPVVVTGSKNVLVVRPHKVKTESGYDEKM